MDLNELFGEKPKVTLIDGSEHELSYTARGLLYLEKQYQGKEMDGFEDDKPKSDEVTKPKTMKLKDALAIMHYFVVKASMGITFDEVCNLLFAGLAHTKEFKNYEEFLDLVDVLKTNDYANKIVVALSEALYTPEQIKKMEAINARAEASGESKNAEAPAVN